MIILCTAINEGYAQRALPYLRSIEQNSNFDKNVCVLVQTGNGDFSCIDQSLFKNVEFRTLRPSDLVRPNENGCIQHGDYLDALQDLSENDVIVFTDADIILQRGYDESELEIFEALSDESNSAPQEMVFASYNWGPSETLNHEAAKLGGIQNQEIARLYFGAAWDDLLIYNVGVVVATKKALQRLRELYNNGIEKFMPVFSHVARQQFLISLILGVGEFGFKPCILPNSFHSHGHRHPREPLGAFSYSEEGLLITEDEKGSPKVCMFRHAI